MSILSYSRQQLKEFFLNNQFKAFRADQILEWIYKKNILSFDDMTNLSLDLRKFVNKNFKIFSLKLKYLQNSKDGQTKKYLFELEDGHLIESVLILSKDRRTVCVSTQVGCPVRCSFCASGEKGFFRNLKAHEIIEQLLYVSSDIGKKVTNVVFMGMGEPLLNFDNVLKAVEIISDEKGMGISQRKITISTVGILENIKKLRERNLKINLALSLHAPTDEIRNEIMPYTKKYKIEDLIMELKKYLEETKRKITFEYILIENVNDRLEHAEKLFRLLKDFQCFINLIPYNPVKGLRYRKTNHKKTKEFFNYLVSKNLNVVQRYEKGSDIKAACGQLSLKKQNNLHKFEDIN